MVAILVAPLLYGFLIEPNRLVVSARDLTLPGWPRALDGTKIAVLSDLHVGSPFIGEAKLAAIVAETDAASPDLIVLLGDFVVGDEPGNRFVPPEAIASALA